MGGYDEFDGERWICANDANDGMGPPWGLPSDNVSSICIRANGHPVIGPTKFIQGQSPLPLEQLWELESRAIDGGYEVWIGTAGEAIAVVTVITAVTGDLDGDGVVEVGRALAREDR